MSYIFVYVPSSAEGLGIIHGSNFIVIERPFWWMDFTTGCLGNFLRAIFTKALKLKLVIQLVTQLMTQIRFSSNSIWGQCFTRGRFNPRKWFLNYRTFNSDEKTADSATRNGQGSESPQRVHSKISLLYFLGQDDVIQSSYTLSDSTKNTLRRVRRIM